MRRRMVMGKVDISEVVQACSCTQPYIDTSSAPISLSFALTKICRINLPVMLGLACERGGTTKAEASDVTYSVHRRQRL